MQTANSMTSVWMCLQLACLLVKLSQPITWRSCRIVPLWKSKFWHIYQSMGLLLNNKWSRPVNLWEESLLYEFMCMLLELEHSNIFLPWSLRKEITIYSTQFWTTKRDLYRHQFHFELMIDWISRWWYFLVFFLTISRHRMFRCVTYQRKWLKD